MQKENRKKEPEIQLPRYTRVSVWTPVAHKNLESSFDAEWPEFNTDRERIRQNTKRYANTSITEAMCGVKEETIKTPELPVTPEVGKLFKVKLTKHGETVIIDNLSTKETVICRNNLKRYTNMYVTEEDVYAKVVSVDKTRHSITIDVLQPIIDEWIKGILADKSVQYDIHKPMVTTVSNLQLCNGGFIGKAEVPVLSAFVGEPYYVDAFIPGSQIVLNIENDFTKWNGQTVDTFVAGYTTKPGSQNQMSLICSRKALLNYSGNLAKIDMYKGYCEDSKEWKRITKSTFAGVITGVINSSKKCGVFVEIPMFNITGMINVSPAQLVNYKTGEDIQVKITDFEQMVEYNPMLGQKTHLQPYVIENDRLKSCILKPVLELA